MKITVIAILFLFLSPGFSANASTISQLSIIGDDSLPGITGNYATDSSFSWVSNRFPTSTIPHSWALGPGSSGGVIFDQPQSGGEMIATRPVYNQPAIFSSIGTGLSINDFDVIDMSNLLLRHAGTFIEIGAGSSVDVLVPRVSDINFLQPGENGWALNNDGSYHLLYNTIGTCTGCDLTLHLYGTAVPVPASVWLLASGLIGLIGFARRNGVLFKPCVG